MPFLTKPPFTQILGSARLSWVPSKYTPNVTAWQLKDVVSLENAVKQLKRYKFVR